MCDYSEATGWTGGCLVTPVLMSSQGPSSSCRLPREVRVALRPSFRAMPSATLTYRSVSGAPRRRRPCMAGAWGTLDPLAPLAPLTSPSHDSGNVNGEPPLVTVHVNNQSCAASGSEAFFNLTQHGGRRGTAITRSTSCVSTLTRGTIKVHPWNSPALAVPHASLTLAGRRLGRSFSAAPADGSSLVMTGSRLAARRTQRQRPPPLHEHHHYQQNLLVHHQPLRQPKLPSPPLPSIPSRPKEESPGVMPRSLTPPPLPPPKSPPPVPPELRAPTASPEPTGWNDTGYGSVRCTCHPCSLGLLVSRAYKAVIKAASSCEYFCIPIGTTSMINDECINYESCMTI